MRPLFLQLEPMRTLAGQLKKDRESALNKVTLLEQEMDKVIMKIQVASQQRFYLHELQTTNKKAVDKCRFSPNYKFKFN